MQKGEPSAPHHKMLPYMYSTDNANRAARINTKTYREMKLFAREIAAVGQAGTKSATPSVVLASRNRIASATTSGFRDGAGLHISIWT